MSLAFVRGLHRWLVNSPHKGPVTWKMFPFDDVIMIHDNEHDFCVTMVGWVDVLDSDRGDFRRQHVVNVSSWYIHYIFSCDQYSYESSLSKSNQWSPLCFRYCDNALDMEAATVTASTSASDETSHKKVHNTVLKMNLLCQGPWSSCLVKDHCLSCTEPCGFSH